MDKLEIVMPLFFMEREKITALEDKLIVEYKSLSQEVQYEYKYSDLKSKVIRGKVGDPGWTTIGNYLLTAAVTIAVADAFFSRDTVDFPHYALLVLGLGLLALVAYCLRLIKYDKVWFVENDNDSSILFKITSRNREEAEKLIRYIEEKIKEVESKTPSQT